jgi:hypothetical protein
MAPNNSVSRKCICIELHRIVKQRILHRRDQFQHNRYKFSLLRANTGLCGPGCMAPNKRIPDRGGLDIRFRPGLRELRKQFQLHILHRGRESIANRLQQRIQRTSIRQRKPGAVVPNQFLPDKRPRAKLRRIVQQHILHRRVHLAAWRQR